MTFEPAGVMQPASELNGNHSNHREGGTPEPVAPAPARRLRVAEPPARNRVQRLIDLTDTLLRETENLARDKAFTEESNRLRAMNLAEGIDFYHEVRHFETGLIRLALDQTGGHQAKAAKLLHIKPTTLNSKIKLYGIEY
jgi:DNA-binding NtrC family response regulator